MKCNYCPSFECKLNSDYKRHIATKSHLANEEKIKNKEKENNNDLYLFQHYLIIWLWKMKKILVDLRDLKGIDYQKCKSMIIKFK